MPKGTPFNGVTFHVSIAQQLSARNSYYSEVDCTCVLDPSQYVEPGKAPVCNTKVISGEVHTVHQ